MSPSSFDHPNGRFATTQWSLVVAAGQEPDEQSREALSALCQWYWPPLYSFARFRGYSAADAADLTQGFFATLLEKHYLQAADRQRGRFRTFLLTAFQRFLLNEHDRTQALKRGGQLQVVSLNVAGLESQLQIEPADHRTPETIFERRWAITLLDRSLERLEREMNEKGRQVLFDLCRDCLTTSGTELPYREIADRCGTSAAAVKTFVYRLKSRFREILTNEVRQTINEDAEVNDELRCLLQAIQNK